MATCDKCFGRGWTNDHPSAPVTDTPAPEPAGDESLFLQSLAARDQDVVVLEQQIKALRAALRTIKGIAESAKFGGDLGTKVAQMHLTAFLALDSIGQSTDEPEGAGQR